MKKNTIKAFTLVEMLIVIVIIGILIASLMPRMQTAQGRARDVARKNDLSQIQTAIITSQQDKWEWPEYTAAQAGINIWDNWTDSSTVPQKVAKALVDAGMTQVPSDPNGDNIVSGLWSANVSWRYAYMVTKRNSVIDGWFVLMAKTEVEWGSNWIVCPTDGDGVKCTPTGSGTDATKMVQTCWVFGGSNTVDLKDIVLCTKFNKWTTACNMDKAWTCNYTDEGQLRYILVY